MCVIEIHVRDVNALSERHRIRAKYITIRVCRMSCIGVTTEPCVGAIWLELSLAACSRK